MAEKVMSPTKFKYMLAGLMVLVSTSAGFVGGWLGASSQKAQENQEEARQLVLNESQIISDIAEEVGPSVVSINVISERGQGSLFGAYRLSSAGTGFIVSDDGVVITNRHVVPSGTRELSITLSDGTELDEVEVIGRTGADDPLDIAFLQIKDDKGKDLKPVRLGNSSEVEVGSMVVAIGNALGQFQNTVTSGIISGFGRNVEAGDETGSDSLQNLFQTDAAINQGNSGGPLVDINGDVIGVTTAVAGGAENIGFAIPIDDIKGLINSVLESGELTRPYLGVRYVQLNQSLADEFELNVSEGAYLHPSSSGGSSVIKDSPAAKAGLKEGDVITKVNGEEIDDNKSLTSLIGSKRVGEEVTLTVVRDGREQEIKVTLEQLPDN